MYFASGQLWYLAISSSLFVFYLNGMVINYCEHVISVKLSQAFACMVLLTWPQVQFFSHVRLSSF